MIAFWSFAFLSMIAVDRLNRFNIKTTVREHQFKLYALRDKLREAVMQEEINPKNWVFLYLDSSIAKTIDVLEKVTLWRVLLSIFVTTKDKRVLRARMHLMRELAKPNNKPLAEIHNGYVMLVGQFILSRHQIIFLTATQIFKAIEAGQKLRRKYKLAIELQTEAPETSTLIECVPA